MIHLIKKRNALNEHVFFTESKYVMLFPFLNVSSSRVPTLSLICVSLSRGIEEGLTFFLIFYLFIFSIFNTSTVAKYTYINAQIIIFYVRLKKFLPFWKGQVMASRIDASVTALIQILNILKKFAWLHLNSAKQRIGVALVLLHGDSPKLGTVS